MTVHAVILAAGRGTRAGPGAPKQYRDLGGATVLRRAVEALRAAPGVNGVRVVIHPEDRAAYEAAVAGLDLPPPILGGATRAASALAALETLAAEGAAPDDLVLLHDAARPFPSPRLIAQVIAALARHPAACPALPMTDTVRRAAEGGLAGATLDRAGLVRAQTPQGFRLGPILRAHRAARDAGRHDAATDDVALAQAAGLDVALTPGDEDNAKITTAQDLRRARALAAARRAAQGGRMDIRIGSGFDVHAFGPGDHVTLCGVRIPHERGLTGHSDADVGLHAIADAIFGALAEGDIGRWFPPSDPQWRGARSEIFLAKAAERVRARGGRIGNVDCTLICERPRIGPHAEAMRAEIARILDIPAERVSVKATTTERLGFAGREEGIAAQASALIVLEGEA
ncbi:bifunctional 2-C-methyl-D-erythritol 4-phosphate cytidylyltransferase/2-C-methyl-D-erythritol 2,4-cyclodiphosphate synthase [Oceanicella actignis]|uniref:Bifunctional enzyme IspD/IspF n=1 Tax=Oceanicella actignis TaxID=1189325 RepID=A0A1M7RV57_9RHOB|nr:bifunctional 2-C-methyl-D-erythritol 4-phosphate cytidylyltransferase/2-C-methyl-D-erythritol 2,4-cyclodiphosphate synthase [Oceanicella actignis]SET02188.1 2-C-methyl-D-erythritol 2,4-cyclodiphosphate synthase [Oceanicella actignis]SHN50161.1 2-C-methyl-D-erythritol 2,4-cyclodiphosphate synthase [Oceanicella actignis]